jgi:predicted nucleotidyltransferase
MAELVSEIFSKSGIKLLRVFLYKPNVEMHQAEIINVSGLSKVTVMNLLKTYHDNDILKFQKKGDLKLFSINFDHPVVRQLKVLLNVSEIRTAIKDLSSPDIEVYLFGSAARGDDTEKSDIDLLVLTSGDKRSITDKFIYMKNSINREINPVTYNFMEFAALPNTDKAFYASIEKDMIRLI